jgi:hypothetical protein
MRKLGPVAFLVSLVVILAPTSVLAQTDAAEESEQPSFLFVLSGSSGSAEDGTLTLDGVSSVVYFSDRPDRIAGHISLADLSASWGAVGDESAFAADPPNAVLSLLEEDVVDNVVLELLALQTSDETATFTVEVLDGTLPTGTFGAASLFIDNECPPLTAALAALAPSTQAGTSQVTPRTALGGLVFQNNYTLIICLTPGDINHIQSLS